MPDSQPESLAISGSVFIGFDVAQQLLRRTSQAGAGLDNLNSNYDRTLKQGRLNIFGNPADFTSSGQLDRAPQWAPDPESNVA